MCYNKWLERSVRDVRRFAKMILILFAALMLSGCNMRTVDQLYCLPKRSKAYDNLQAVIDEAMDGLTISAPVYGENRQTVQMADLDGDGVDEYLLFASDNTEKPLKILIFSQLASGYVLMDTIEGYGMGFDFVEYAQLDDRPGLEIVVGRQVSDQVVRSLSVYRFTSGTARHLLTTGYSRLSVCNLDGNETSELFLLTHSSAEDGKGQVMLYSYQDGEMIRSPMHNISVSAAAFSRFTEGKLEDGRLAMFVSCETEDKTIITDAFLKDEDQLLAVSKGITTPALQEYRVYPADVDGDGVLELAGILPLDSAPGSKKQNLLQWYSLDQQGKAVKKLCTYHNFAEGWFLTIDSQLIEYVKVEQDEDATVFFYVKDGTKTPMVTLLALTDANREEQSKQKDRVVLYKSDAVIYAADITAEGIAQGITAETIKAVFFPIRGELTNEGD